MTSGRTPVKWTYGQNPSASPSDAVRFIVGDTNGCDPLFSDAEVAYLLASRNNDPMAAAIFGLQSLIAKFSMLPESETVGSVSISNGDRASKLASLLETIKANAAVGGTASFVAGGISVAEIDTNEQDTDRPRFDVRPGCWWGDVAPPAYGWYLPR